MELLKEGRWLCLLILVGCGTSISDQDNTKSANLLANQFVDAFYSFSRDSLERVLATAKQSQPNILYYQKWAECGHYKVLERGDIIHKSDTLVFVPVTVKDDLMSALQIDFNVTDTFHVVVIGGQIRSVETSSNDPDTYYEAKEWVKNNRPELIDTECERIWDGGPTPCDCIQGYINGFRHYVKAKEVRP